MLSLCIIKYFLCPSKNIVSFDLRYWQKYLSLHKNNTVIHQHVSPFFKKRDIEAAVILQYTATAAQRQQVTQVAGKEKEKKSKNKKLRVKLSPCQLWTTGKCSGARAQMRTKAHPQARSHTANLFLRQSEKKKREILQPLPGKRGR